jgi:cystathionine beta-lyase/cystathionine gamma-synthase
MGEPSESRAQGPYTRAVHGADRGPGPESTPVVHSTTFAFDTLDALLEAQARGAAGAFYQREGHPTLHACEERLALLEEAPGGLLFASGMAAITAALLGLLRAGDHVVALRQCYGGTLAALRWGRERLGWNCDLVDAADPDAWARAVRAGTRLFHVESPTNPTLEVVDLARAAELAHRHGALLSVDNTFASPVGQHPMAHGADVVLYSATKSISGHSDVLAGAALARPGVLREIEAARRVFGGVPDPGTAWLIERSLKTLPLRVERANANAGEIARRLEGDPRIARLHYPGRPSHPGHALAARQMTLGFGPVLSFEVADGAAARAVVEGFRLIRHAPSLGSVTTLAMIPALTSLHRFSPEERARAGVPDGLVRIAVGIEDVDDLWADLDGALARAAAVAGRRGP